MTNKRTPERCGNCRWHLFDDAEGASCCVCKESDCYTGYTEHTDWCEQWEKDPKRSV